MYECCHEDGALLAARRSIRHPTASLVPASHPDRSTRPVPNDGTQHEAEAPLRARRTWRGFDLSDFEAATGVRSLDPRPPPRARDHLVGARLARDAQPIGRSCGVFPEIEPTRAGHEG